MGAVFLFTLVYAAFGLPFILMKQGGDRLWLGVFVLAVESVLAVIAGRKLLPLLRAKTKLPESMLGVPLLLVFFLIYATGNLLTMFIMLAFVPQ